MKLMKNQRGDTIVEVLIAMAIISLVLASSYAITTRNVNATQDTQEHNQAQQVIQQQIERLRVLSATNAIPSSFVCITGTGSAVQASSSTAACSFIADGTAGCTNEPCFHVLITGSAATGIYTIGITWTSVSGGNSSTKLVYGV